RDVDTERLCGLEIDDELERRRLHDRQITRFDASKNAASVDAGLAIGIGETDSVADQSTRLGELSERIDRDKARTCSKSNDILAPGHVEWIATDQQCVRTLPGERTEGSFDVAGRAGVDHPQLQSRRRFIRSPRRRGRAK